jgi:hypothetical protein
MNDPDVNNVTDPNTVPDPNAEPTKNPVKTPNIPRADIDLKDAAESVNEAWSNMPAFTLLWLLQSEFELIVTNYGDVLMSRKSTGSTRPEFTVKLKVLDKKINDNLFHIKDYLVAKYGSKTAPSYFSQFGIIHKYNSYNLPKDRNERKAALVLLVAAITTQGFQTMDYGLAYWTAIKTEYDLLLPTAETIDGTVSSKVGNKNELKKQIKKALNAIINLLKANYPDTYKNEMRAWGLQKEKY